MLPRLFIVGAPKCGTTALWTYLSQHPMLYLPAMKEPHFFNTDHRYRTVRTWAAYRDLFSQPSATAVMSGEASVWYLYSQAAASEIMSHIEDPYFIVMVRDPVEMFASLHEQLFVSGRENVASAEEAWRLQWARKDGKALPPRAVEPSHLMYGRVCSLGDQIERLLPIAGRRRVRIVRFDRFQEDPSREYRSVLSFLGLPDDGRAEFPRVNAAKTVRSAYTAGLLRDLMDAGRAMKSRLGIRSRTGVLGALKRLILTVNVRERPRRPLGDAFKEELRDFFRADMVRLEDLLIDLDEKQR